MSRLEGSYIRKKRAIGIAQSLKRRGFSNIAVIPVEDRTFRTLSDEEKQKYL